jgi:hypothetical protein
MLVNLAKTRQRHPCIIDFRKRPCGRRTHNGYLPIADAMPGRSFSLLQEAFVGFINWRKVNSDTGVH